jgi:hypothetical protein
MISTAYRNDLDALLVARDELLEQRWQELDRVAPLRAVGTRRQAAIAGGAAMAAGGLLMFLFAVTQLLAGAYSETLLTSMLLGTWAIAGVVYAGTSFLVSHKAVLAERSRTARTADPRADLLALRSSHPLPDALDHADRGLGLRLGMPLVGVAMVLPLSLHLVVALLAVDVAGFEQWIRISAVCVGHSHLVLAALAWRYAGKLATQELAVTSWLNESLIALAITAASAIVPTVVYGPALIIMTGILPVPFLFWLAHRRAALERQVIDRYARELDAAAS